MAVQVKLCMVRSDFTQYPTRKGGLGGPLLFLANPLIIMLCTNTCSQHRNSVRNLETNYDTTTFTHDSLTARLRHNLVIRYAWKIALVPSLVKYVYGTFFIRTHLHRIRSHFRIPGNALRCLKEHLKKSILRTVYYFQYLSCVNTIHILHILLYSSQNL